VEEIDLENVSTRISWSLEESGKFFTRSMYLVLCKKPKVPLTKYIWSYLLKIKIFTWQLSQGRLPANELIQSRGGASTGNCALCGQIKTEEHIFFQCPLAVFMWSGVREMFRVKWHRKSRVD
jgi:hypothetical protein